MFCAVSACRCWLLVSDTTTELWVDIVRIMTLLCRQECRGFLLHNSNQLKHKLQSLHPPVNVPFRSYPRGGSCCGVSHTVPARLPPIRKRCRRLLLLGPILRLQKTTRSMNKRHDTRRHLPARGYQPHAPSASHSVSMLPAWMERNRERMPHSKMTTKCVRRHNIDKHTEKRKTGRGQRKGNIYLFVNPRGHSYLCTPSFLLRCCRAPPPCRDVGAHHQPGRIELGLSFSITSLLEKEGIGETCQTVRGEYYVLKKYAEVRVSLVRVDFAHCFHAVPLAHMITLML